MDPLLTEEQADLKAMRSSLHMAGVSLDTVYDRSSGTLPRVHRLILSAAIMAVAELRHWTEEELKEVMAST